MDETDSFYILSIWPPIIEVKETRSVNCEFLSA